MGDTASLNPRLEHIYTLCSQIYTYAHILQHRIPSTIINEHKKREDKELRNWKIGMAQKEGRQDQDGLYT